MYDMKRYFNRQSGHGMNIIKFHQLLPTVDDIIEFGSHQNFNGGPGESTHCQHKQVTNLTKHSPNYSFVMQSAIRHTENFIVKKHNIEIDVIDNKIMKNNNTDLQNMNNDNIDVIKQQ